MTPPIKKISISFPEQFTITDHAYYTFQDGLKKKHEDTPDIKVELCNENEKNPYDIIIYKADKVLTYVEVKTTHNQERTFTMSEREFKFAKENQDQYQLYLITNAGAGKDSSYTEIESIDKLLQEKTLKITSRKFSLY